MAESVSIWSSGWKEATEIHVWSGSAWLECNEVYVWVGSGWLRVFTNAV